jgi:hypothetical protein
VIDIELTIARCLGLAKVQTETDDADIEGRKKRGETTQRRKREIEKRQLARGNNDRHVRFFMIDSRSSQLQRIRE